jgi:hypothetical protein
MSHARACWHLGGSVWPRRAQAKWPRILLRVAAWLVDRCARRGVARGEVAGAEEGGLAGRVGRVPRVATHRPRSPPLAAPGASPFLRCRFPSLPEPDEESCVVRRISALRMPRQVAHSGHRAGGRSGGLHCCRARRSAGCRTDRFVGRRSAGGRTGLGSLFLRRRWPLPASPSSPFCLTCPATSWPPNRTGRRCCCGRPAYSMA